MDKYRVPNKFQNKCRKTIVFNSYFLENSENFRKKQPLKIYRHRNSRKSQKIQENFQKKNPNFGIRFQFSE